MRTATLGEKWILTDDCCPRCLGVFTAARRGGGEGEPSSELSESDLAGGGVVGGGVAERAA